MLTIFTRTVITWFLRTLTLMENGVHTLEILLRVPYCLGLSQPYWISRSGLVTPSENAWRPQGLKRLFRSSSQLWQYRSNRYHVSYAAQSAISPPSNPGGRYFYYYYIEEETVVRTTQVQGHTAGKWQNWGSNQSGWFTAHASPNLLERSLFSGLTEALVTEKQHSSSEG